MFIELCTLYACSLTIRVAIVFGCGRPHCGVLLNIYEQAQGLSVNEFKRLVWPVIEAANCDAPSHSALVWEIVKVLPEGTEVPVATKMSILRPACYAKFKSIISASLSYSSGRTLVHSDGADI